MAVATVGTRGSVPPGARLAEQPGARGHRWREGPGVLPGAKMVPMHLCRSALVSVPVIPDQYQDLDGVSPGQCQDLDSVSPAKCWDPEGVSPSRLVQGRCVMHHPRFTSLMHPPGSRFL